MNQTESILLQHYVKRRKRIKTSKIMEQTQKKLGKVLIMG